MAKRKRTRSKKRSYKKKRRSSKRKSGRKKFKKWSRFLTRLRRPPVERKRVWLTTQFNTVVSPAETRVTILNIPAGLSANERIGESITIKKITLWFRIEPPYNAGAAANPITATCKFALVRWTDHQPSAGTPFWQAPDGVANTEPFFIMPMQQSRQPIADAHSYKVKWSMFVRPQDPQRDPTGLWRLGFAGFRRYFIRKTIKGMWPALMHPTTDADVFVRKGDWTLHFFADYVITITLLARVEYYDS